MWSTSGQSMDLIFKSIQWDSIMCALPCCVMRCFHYFFIVSSAAWRQWNTVVQPCRVNFFGKGVGRIRRVRKILVRSCSRGFQKNSFHWGWCWAGSTAAQRLLRSLNCRTLIVIEGVLHVFDFSLILRQLLKIYRPHLLVAWHWTGWRLWGSKSI